MEDIGNLPFSQTEHGNTKIRIFDSNIDEHELMWHRDPEDREVTILESKGWKFQMDNSLPIELFEGRKIFIPKDTFHRVIKGEGNLKLKIKIK